MHWLVEVSRVGDTVASERYCIDARRWQSALQEARRMRGDAGALPKLTIELTDNGYRAIDPELKVRYQVSEAPPGMPVTDGARAILSTAPPPATESNPPAPKSSAQASAVKVSAAPDAPAPSRPVSAAPVPVTAPLVAPAPPSAPRVEADDPVVTVSGPPEVATAPVAAPPPVAASAPPVAAVAPVAAPAPIAAGAPSVAAAPIAASPPPVSEPAPATPTSPSAPPPAPLPSVQVIRQREEKPSDANPIAYRELALAVKAGATRAEVEALLLARLAEESSLLAADTRRFVQLAVFDHVFVKRPVRAPLGTLIWKDWRGEPVLAFPGFGEADELGPPSSSSTARMPSWSPGMMTSVVPRMSSAAPAAPAAPASSDDAPPTPPLASQPINLAAPPPTAASVAPAPTSVAPAPGRVDSVKPARVVSVGPSKPPADAPIALTQVRPPSDAPAEAERAARAGRGTEPHEHAPGASSRRSEPGRRSDPPSRRSDPSLARRRAPGEDLIGDLFERMHELTFMADIPSGADYVLNVLYDMIPCEAMLVHVFDLGRREFVVVRAHGPHARDALLHRTPDHDPLIQAVMQKRSVVANGSAPHSRAFERLGVHALQVLSGSARQGGRYLGLIELANPLGGTPFHQGEVNALEYVCEQFAEFVAGRPVVLDEDIVLRA